MELDSLWNIAAVLLGEERDFQKSIKVLEQIKSKYTAPEDIENKISCTLYQGYCCLELGDLEQMKDYLFKFEIETLALSDSLKQSSFFGDYHYLQGLYFFRQGYYSIAGDHYRETLRKIKGGEEEFSYRIEDVFNNLGIIYQRIGDFKEAIPFIEISKIGLSDPVEITTRNANLALCDIALKEYDKAEALLIDGLNTLKRFKEHPEYLPRFIAHKVYLAKLYNLKEQPHLALEQLSAITSEGVNPDKRLEILLEKGIANLRLGDNAAAEKNYLQVLDQSAASLVRKHPNVANSLNGLSQIYSEQGDFKKALELINTGLDLLYPDSLSKRTVSLVEKLPTIQAKPIYFELLLAKSKLLQKSNDDLASLDALIDASAVLESLILENLASDQSKYFWIEKAKPLFNEIIIRCINQKNKNRAWEFIQKGKAILLTQSIHQLSYAEEKAGLANLIRSRRYLEMEINYLESKSKHYQDTISKKIYLERILSNRHRKDSISRIIENNYPNIEKWDARNSILGIADARKRLPNEKSLLLDMFVGGANVYLVGLTQKELYLEEIEFTPMLKKQLVTFQQLLSRLNLDMERFTQFSNLGYQLYHTIFKKVIEAPQENIRNIIFIPDEEFNYLPLGALLTDLDVIKGIKGVRYDQLPYLIKQVDISYEYATELYGYDRKNKKQDKENIFMGYAPVFSGGNSPNRSLDSLLHNITEVRVINKIVGGKINIAQSATKKSFLEDIKNFKIAHLATHAICNDSLPFDSNIQFYDDSLKLFEIVNIPNNLDLVVLSACETGIGKLRKGEGISSLARGFANSGCPSIVTTLWKVDDKQTANLMELFYENLYAQQRKQVALGTAQRSYLENINTASLAHPFYWASFIQIGNTESIAFDKNSNYLWVALVILFLTLLVIRLFRK